jgi:hypothetical protein
VRDILATARLLRDGVLKSTWTTGTLVLRPEAPEDALEAIGPDSALFIGGDEWVVTIGQEMVPLGPCHRIFFPSADRRGAKVGGWQPASGL